MTERVSERAASIVPFTLLPLSGDTGMICEGDFCFVPGADDDATDASGSPSPA